MDIDSQHRAALKEMEELLTRSAEAMSEMKDYYEAEFDNLSEEEQDGNEGDEIKELISHIEEVCDRLDLAIIDICVLIA